MILVTRRRKSSLVSHVLVFLEDMLSLSPKREIENLVGLVPIENYNCSSWEMSGIELLSVVGKVVRSSLEV